MVSIMTIPNFLQAQIFDGFTTQKGDLSVTAAYTYSTFDEFYFGTEKMNPIPAHNEITQNIFSLYAKYGITDNITAVVNLPYIDASGDGDSDPVNTETSVADLQDLSIAVKVNAYKLNLKEADLNLVTGIGFNIPLGYEPNGILSIGSGAFAVDYTAGLHLNTDVGFFSTLFATYSLRGDADNNLIPGVDDFSVPNTFTTLGKIGYASDLFYLEAWAKHTNSEEGVDIGGAGFFGNFPETNVDYSMFGATIYKNIIPELGVSLGYSQIFDGRNVGASQNYSIGVTYNFTK